MYKNEFLIYKISLTQHMQNNPKSTIKLFIIFIFFNKLKYQIKFVTTHMLISSFNII